MVRENYVQHDYFLLMHLPSTTAIRRITDEGARKKTKPPNGTINEIKRNANNIDTRTVNGDDVISEQRANAQLR